MNVLHIKCNEHLLYFMQCGMMRLSAYDLKFIQNLQTIIASANKITSNQVALFDKLVLKYGRQFLKHKISPEHISTLQWNTPMVMSDPKFTEAYICIENDIIKFRSPFSKKFVDAMRNNKHHSFKWIKDTKNYQTNFNANSFKVIVDLAHEHYERLNFCPITKELLLDLIEKYGEVKYWTPTLVKINNQYMIAAINNHVNSAIGNITLSDDPFCLSTLSVYGVDICDSIIQNNKLLKFSGTYAPEVDIHTEDIVSYLKAIECDAVFFAGKSFLNKAAIYPQLLQKLNDEKIIYHVKFDPSQHELVKKYNRPVLINFAYNFSPGAHFLKIIKVKNSIEVNIK